ncbi:MAG: hypothetical protein JWO44_1678 [Bacteroidetes bacterium]|nr:hypothetical protein [Bacteroidota bacterium]
MKENRIQLTFTCPVKWDSMSPDKSGRYCSSCKKTVKDFTKQPVEEICSDAETGNYECGNFLATQLHKPFGDWRDKLIEHYQNLVKNRSSKRMALLFVTLFIFLAGCRSRRLGGAYTYYGGNWDYKGNHTKATAQVDSTAVKAPALK